MEDNDPAYIRVGRNAVEDVYDSVPENFQMDKALTVREGTDVTLIACGELVRPALDAALLLEEKGISARVIDMYCVKPWTGGGAPGCPGDQGHRTPPRSTACTAAWQAVARWMGEDHPTR